MGSDKVTLRDVAAAAGVSPMTASNALRGKPGVKSATRQKVLAAAKQLDYRINLTASALKSGRSNIIHIVINDFETPYFSKLAQAISTETTARGLIPFIEQTGYSTQNAERALASSPFSGQQFDGEILNANVMGSDIPLAELSRGRPFVMINACEQEPTVDAVDPPNEEGARLAVQHLIERGCRTIALVGAPYTPRAELANANGAFALRLRGASGALLDAGLPYDSARTFAAGGRDDGLETGHRIAHAIFDARDRGVAPIDGICCANDYAALNIMRGLADFGLRAPEDVRIIGFDGIAEGAYATPSLSTIAIDFDQLARFTLDALIRRIDETHHADGTDRRPASRAIVGHRLIARESTAAAPRREP